MKPIEQIVEEIIALDEMGAKFVDTESAVQLAKSLKEAYTIIKNIDYEYNHEVPEITNWLKNYNKYEQNK